ncbi:aminotransferase, class V [Bacteriovorax sp. BSW11_IV]|uniref:cysteine desulfurase family protein n=1 Tax=Bacteriovorax sp. BSW11_IV TaxID=1353529 RepID=UPI00038A4762|nr:aminotransferase class V-fold PLP-dependent enzyme [Bacteriovorax sp. BSW11_IV]EQC46437.1 aminotransferase, class V [Bacteriovorax sp. BSW11_IV]
MKLTNNRFYFDYNATSPLAESVTSWLSSGDLPFGNPSSIHSSGKLSKRYINETREFLYQTFGLNDFRLFFHSGATEGINSIVRGLAYELFKNSEKLTFICSPTDHSCIYNLKEELELFGHQFVVFDIDENGEFSYENLRDLIKAQTNKVLLNYTFVNNESGVVWPLDMAVSLKEETGCFVHVDAVQAVGKIKEWQELSEKIDAFTFSAHKFGAMKGIGFSFMRTDFPFHSLIRGGGQQEGLRSGTENVHAIYSIKLALESLMKSYDFSQQVVGKNIIENEILKEIPSLKLVGAKANHRNGNTIYLVIPNKKADILLTAFDLAKMDVSSGSACSSGAVIPSRVLMAMGYSEDEAKGAVRLSFAPSLDVASATEYATKIVTVLKRFA